MLFLNISADKVQIIYGSREILLDRNGIENILGKELIKLYRGSAFDSVLLLNGPGGFTNLRVGSLVLNLLNELIPQKVKIFNITKIDLYKYLVSVGFLPSRGMIYLGQKRNVWDYDLSLDRYELFSIEQSVNMVDGDFFLDFVVEDYWPANRDKMIYWQMDQDNLKCCWDNKSISISIQDLSLEPVYSIEPKYFIGLV